MRVYIFLTIIFISFFSTGAVQTKLADKVLLGVASSSDKTIEFNSGLGTANPKIKMNTSSKLQMANDGVNFKNLGGSNGVSGINLLTNPGFENGIIEGWTSSGGGSLSAITSGSNLMYETTTALYTASAPGGKYLESSLVAVPAILFGGRCMAKISFVGGSAGAELSVFDQTGTSVTGGRVATLSVASIKKDLILYFNCPTSGSIKLRITTTAALNYTYLDEMFLGSAPLADSLRPTITILAATSGTYTTPTGVKYIRVRAVGPGGGGAGGGAGGTGNGSNGSGATTFGPITAGIGYGGSAATGSGGSGGTASFTAGPLGVAFFGGYGGGLVNTTVASGASGGVSQFSGGAGNGQYAAAGLNAFGHGSGGGGGGANGVGASGGAGGGAGGFVDVIINDPDPTYSWAVGVAGAGGAAGTNGFAGGSGGNGYILVEEFY